MKNFRLFSVLFTCLVCLLVTGCGDAVALTTKISAKLTQKNNFSLENRSPQIVIQQFFAALQKADFQLAATYCDGEAKVFMEYCIATQQLQDPAEYGFWSKEFASFTSARFGDLQFVDLTFSEQLNADVATYVRPAYKEVLFDGNRPRAFDLSYLLLAPKLTAGQDERNAVTENVKKNFAVVERPACKFQVVIRKDKNNSYKIVNIFPVQETTDAEEDPGAVDDEFSQEFMSLTEESGESEKKPAPAPQDDQGMAGDDFGFGEF